MGPTGAVLRGREVQGYRVTSTLNKWNLASHGTKAVLQTAEQQTFNRK